MPLIDSSYGFSELPKAFEKMKSGHLRGKIVVALPGHLFVSRKARISQGLNTGACLDGLTASGRG